MLLQNAALGLGATACVAVVAYRSFSRWLTDSPSSEAAPKGSGASAAPTALSALPKLDAQQHRMLGMLTAGGNGGMMGLAQPLGASVKFASDSRGGTMPPPPTATCGNGKPPC